MLVVVLGHFVAGGWLVLAANSNSWIHSYAGKSTNEFVSDKRGAELIKHHIPPTIAGDVIGALGGPPEPVILREGRYAFASACAWHNCTKKGFFWFDTKFELALGGYVSEEILHIGSAEFNSGKLPAHASQSVSNWLQQHSITPKSILFYTSAGKPQSLSLAEFSYQAKYTPQPTGPSFDCKRHLTLIEKEICASPRISLLDLKLAELVKILRDGHSTSSAHQQLYSLQREWLRSRNAECGARKDVRDCLVEKYEIQYDTLSNWVPSQ